MPFQDPYKSYFDKIFKPAAQEAGLKPLLADSLFTSNVIISDIYELTLSAKILLADLSKANPNVFYEVGLAHALGKPVILLADDIQWVPFDLKHRRVLIYDTRKIEWDKDLQRGIAVALKETLADPGLGRPFADYGKDLGSDAIRLYRPPRESSDTDMLKDLAIADHAQFIGVSHRNLASYLQSVLRSSAEPLSLKTMRVCYASDEDGRLWEGAQFNSNVRETRGRIAAVLTDPAFRSILPNFTSLEFLQSVYHRTFGGCAFIKDRPNVKTYYVNHYLPHVQRRAEDFLTFRLSDEVKTSGSLRSLHEAYREAFERVLSKARYIGQIRPSVWDLSVDQWREFARNCHAHRASMEQLIRIIKPTAKERILDVGAATGDTSQMLIAAASRLNLTVLDSSPAMVNACREVLGDSAKYALCHIGNSRGDDALDLDNPFDAIVLHLALPALAETETQLFHLAKWCATRLTVQGRIGISIHNTVVESASSDFSPAADELRTTLKRVASELQLQQFFRLRKSHRFRKLQIERAFSRVGFQVVSHSEKRFSMTMTDRLFMWSTPAVLNQLFEVTSLGEENIKFLIERCRSEIGHLNTPDMTVKFWLFRRSSRT